MHNLRGKVILWAVVRAAFPFLRGSPATKLGACNPRRCRMCPLGLPRSTFPRATLYRSGRVLRPRKKQRCDLTQGPLHIYTQSVTICNVLSILCYLWDLQMLYILEERHFCCEAHASKLKRWVKVCSLTSHATAAATYPAVLHVRLETVRLIY